MKLFWNTNKQKKSFWGEYHFKNSNSWIFSLLQNINYNIIDNLDKIKKTDCLIIVDSELNSKENFYLDLRNKCSKIFLIHLGDEGSTEKKDIIYSLCEHIWRTFCLGIHIKDNKITNIPIGYKSGVLREKKLLKDRKYTWTFMGTPHGSSRFDLQYQNKDIKPNYVKLTSSFASKESLSSIDYYKIINETIFALIPHGYFHPETYRLYEALESGCIPIVENPHNYFDNFYKNNQLIKINHWNESKEIMQEIINDKEKLKTKSENIKRWWQEYKEEIKENFKININEK